MTLGTVIIIASTTFHVRNCAAVASGSGPNRLFVEWN
jgi:hypothetical protein